MKDTIQINLEIPKPPSLNKFYAGRHWSFRNNETRKAHTAIHEELKKFDSYTAESFSIHISYRSRYDVDNSILACKFLSDCIVEAGICEDDSPKYFKKLKIVFDPELPLNTYKATITLNGARLSRNSEAISEGYGHDTVLYKSSKAKEDRLQAEGDVGFVQEHWEEQPRRRKKTGKSKGKAVDRGDF